MCCLKWVPMNQKKEDIYHEEYYNPTIIPRFSYSEIYLATSGFATKNMIGKGTFASVYKAQFTNWSGPAKFRSWSRPLLAVKVLDLKRESSKSFDVECEAWRNGRHRNLVRIISSFSGFDYKGAEFKALIMEYMSNGNLDEWLYPKDIETKPALSLTHRLNIAIDVACALDYLHHDCDPPIVHCDLKPGNVLIDEDMASTCRDVYSFGIILLEMFIAKKPSEGMFDLDIFASAVSENQVLSIADPRLFNDTDQSLTQSSFATHSSGGSDGGNMISDTNAIYNWLDMKEKVVAAVIRVGLSCGVHSAKDRITMRQALRKLQEIKKFHQL
ncbi:putative Receptor-kinase [Quillaja saponaria]|uniref:Receptor-kinase n=1 Tax=Quillaja saponaria TaxID=32244 RepID=A0AAD7VNE9_QUISA|nr:putative Receptor-kinase [Quillaja saponaria]